MKQIVQSYRTGTLEIQEAPAPALRRASVLVRTAHSVISPGTERQILELSRASLLGKAKKRPDLVKKVLDKVKQEGLISAVRKAQSALDRPVPLGYTCSGVVVEAGEGCEEFAVGDRVACGGAGFACHAEFNCVPKNLCVKAPAGVTSQQAAFVTLGAIALQGVRQSEASIGDRVAVIGLGVVGLLTVQLLKAAGAFVIAADPNPARRTAAASCCADVVASDPDALHRAALNASGGNGVDAVIICASTGSNRPVEVAGEISRRRGVVVALGTVRMDVPRNLYYQKELALKLSMAYGPGRYDPSYEERGVDYPYAYVRWTENRNMKAFLELAAAGKASPEKLVTHTFPFERALEAYDLLQGKHSAGAMGILLEYAGAADAARTVYAAPSPGRTRAPADQLNLGVIGAGAFARGVLLPAIAKIPGARLHSIAAATGISANQTARKFGFLKIRTDYTEILEDTEIAAVFILTPHSSHAPIAADALKAGKAVFLEKPLAVSTEQLDQLKNVYGALSADENSTPPRLMVGFNRRFSSHTRFLKERFDDLGVPVVLNYRVNAGKLDPASWLTDPAEGGRIVGEVCHFVDFAIHFAGAEPDAVTAVTGAPDNDPSSSDCLIAALRFGNGSLAGVIYAATGPASYPKEFIEVIGGSCVGVIRDFKSSLFHADGKRKKHFTPGQDKGFHAEISSFIESLRTGMPLPIPFEASVLTTETTFRILKALRTGKTA
ncbi:MAG: bi-domain-containing oxidoreductase [bacterium]